MAKIGKWLTRKKVSLFHQKVGNVFFFFCVLFYILSRHGKAFTIFSFSSSWNFQLHHAMTPFPSTFTSWFSCSWTLWSRGILGHCPFLFMRHPCVDYTGSFNYCHTLTRTEWAVDGWIKLLRIWCLSWDRGRVLPGHPTVSGLQG